MVVLAACTGTRSGPPTPSAKAAATSVTSSANPNFIRVMVPPGLVQDGTLDPKTDWVTPFEQQSGCLVRLTTEPTDADAYHDLTTGTGSSFYSAVLASPELAGQLIGAKAVAPLDTKHISGYSRISPRLASAAPEMSGTTAYGQPYLWDSYVTGYDAGKVKPAPDTWTSLFSPSSAKAYAGKITVPQAPVTLALAALYLKSSQPCAGNHRPVRADLEPADRGPARGGGRPSRHRHLLAHRQRGRRAARGRAGRARRGADPPDQRDDAASLPTAGVPALTQAAGSGTAVAYLDSWLVTSHAPNSSCTYKWLSWMTSDYVQERASAFTNAAPVVPAACAGPAAAELRRVPHVQPAQRAQHRVRAPARDQLRPGAVAAPATPPGRRPGNGSRTRRASCPSQRSAPAPAEPSRVVLSVVYGHNGSVEPRAVVILGSTGSIGTQALDVIRRNPDRFRVAGLAAGGGNPALLAQQAIEFGAPRVAVARPSAQADVRSALAAAAASAGNTAGQPIPEVIAGPEAMAQAATWPVRRGPQRGGRRGRPDRHHRRPGRGPDAGPGQQGVPDHRGVAGHRAGCAGPDRPGRLRALHAGPVPAGRRRRRGPPAGPDRERRPVPRLEPGPAGHRHPGAGAGPPDLEHGPVQHA